MNKALMVTGKILLIGSKVFSTVLRIAIRGVVILAGLFITLIGLLIGMLGGGSSW